MGNTKRFELFKKAYNDEIVVPVGVSVLEQRLLRSYTTKSEIHTFVPTSIVTIKSFIPLQLKCVILEHWSEVVKININRSISADRVFEAFFPIFWEHCNLFEQLLFLTYC